MKQALAIISLDKEVLELIIDLKDYEIAGMIDENPKVQAFDVPLLGKDDDWEQIQRKFPRLKLALALDPPLKKGVLVKHYGRDRFVSLLSPHAYVSPRTKIGHGTVIQRGCQIMPDVSVGDFCKINIEALIHHDTTVGNYCTIAPRAHLLGLVTVEEEVFVGAGAIVLPHLRLGKGSTIGAGAVVTKDVPPGKTVKGIGSVTGFIDFVG